MNYLPNFSERFGVLELKFKQVIFESFNIV